MTDSPKPTCSYEQRLLRIARQVSLNEALVWRSRAWMAPSYFAEPGTFLPPNFFGYPLAEPPINQPIGQVEYAIGKNRTLSRPVYGDERGVWWRGGGVRGGVGGGSGPREF